MALYTDSDSIYSYRTAWLKQLIVNAGCHKSTYLATQPIM